MDSRPGVKIAVFAERKEKTLTESTVHFLFFSCRGDIPVLILFSELDSASNVVSL